MIDEGKLSIPFFPDTEDIRQGTKKLTNMICHTEDYKCYQKDLAVLKEQEELESGNFDSIIKGSRAKYLVLQTLTDRGNMVSTSDYAIYAVEKGVDCSVYNQVSRTGANIISIYEQKFYSGGGEISTSSYTIHG